MGGTFQKSGGWRVNKGVLYVPLKCCYFIKRRSCFQSFTKCVNFDPCPHILLLRVILLGSFCVVIQISLVSVEMHSITFVSCVFVIPFVLENLIFYRLICYKGPVCVRIFFLKHKLITSVLLTTQRSYK